VSTLEPKAANIALTTKGKAFAERQARRQAPTKDEQAKTIGKQIEKLLRIRREADETAQFLIGILDDEEPDPDLEPTFGYLPPGCIDEGEPGHDEEPTLGWTATLNQTDRNRLGDSWLVDGECEPTLGAPETVTTPVGPSYDGWTPGGIRRDRMGSQAHWAAGNRQDLEGDPKEDDEDGHDKEPSLGAQNVILGRSMVDGNSMWPSQSQVIDAGMNQLGWTSGCSDSDLEDDPGEPMLASTPLEDATGRYARLGLVDDREDGGDGR
jgi:hypothetical protein